MKKMRVYPWLGIAVTATIAMTGCMGGSTGGTSGGSNQISYLIGTPDTPEQLQSVKDELAAFEKSFGIKVDLKTLDTDALRTVLQTQLRSDSGPDVFSYDTGPGFAGVLAKAGLLYDLTDQYKKQNYPIYEWAKNTVTFDGKIYGIPDEVEQVGLFYNKDIFAQNGLSAPQNFADLEKSAALLKSKGLIPFAQGDKEGWEGGHLLSMALASGVGAAEQQNLISGKSGWNSPGVAAAVNVWKSFSEKGWMPPSTGAITYDNANALFFSGKAAMVATGTWLIGDITKNTKAQVGFVTFPSTTDQGVPVAGVGGGNFVNVNTKKPAAALKFMDYLTSQERAKTALSRDSIPAFPISSPAGGSPLFQQVVADTAKYATGTTAVGKNIDVNMTDVFNKAMSDGMQGVFAGKMTGEQVAQSLQTAAKSG